MYVIHRSFVSVVLVVTFVSAVSFRSFRWFRSFRFDGFVLAFRVLVHAIFKEVEQGYTLSCLAKPFLFTIIVPGFAIYNKITSFAWFTSRKNSQKETNL